MYKRYESVTRALSVNQLPRPQTTTVLPSVQSGRALNSPARRQVYIRSAHGSVIIPNTQSFNIHVFIHRLSTIPLGDNDFRDELNTCLLYTSRCV